MFRTDNNKDRLSYSSLLLPPKGYKLDQAVGTTYSLDLETLMAVTIALGLGEDMDSGVQGVSDNGEQDESIGSLIALQRAKEKVLILCEAGQIKNVGNAKPLMLLLDRMVIPIALTENNRKSNGETKHNGFPAFHAKTWILSYINEAGKKKYRFVVLSRNLTFDRSWDVSFCMDSSEKRGNKKKTEPIINFLYFLHRTIKDGGKKHGKSSKVQRAKQLLQDLLNGLKNESFSLNHPMFEENYSVIPIGIGNSKRKITDEPFLCEDGNKFKFQDLVVVSPFITESVVNNWNKNEHDMQGTHRVLITRKSELYKLHRNSSDNFEIYTLKDDIADCNYIDSDDSSDNSGRGSMDIHAKMYLCRKDEVTDLYIGSMNATYSAIHRNVEMMIRLRSRDEQLSGQSFLKELFCGQSDGPRNPFRRVQVQELEGDDGKDDTNQLEIILKEICRQKMEARVIQENGRFDVKVTISGRILKRWDAVTLSPLSSNIFQPLAKEMDFKDLEIQNLSEFYRIHISDEKNKTISRIITIPTEDIPETREQYVIKEIIKDDTTFMDYVELVLGEDYLMTMLAQRERKDSGLLSDNARRISAVYELLLRAALNDPKRIKEIIDMAEKVRIQDSDMDDNMIPTNFQKLFELFQKVLKLK